MLFCFGPVDNRFGISSLLLFTSPVAYIKLILKLDNKKGDLRFIEYFGFSWLFHLSLGLIPYYYLWQVSHERELRSLRTLLVRAYTCAPRLGVVGGKPITCWWVFLFNLFYNFCDAYWWCKCVFFLKLQVVVKRLWRSGGINQAMQVALLGEWEREASLTRLHNWENISVETTLKQLSECSKAVQRCIRIPPHLPNTSRHWSKLIGLITVSSYEHCKEVRFE